MKDIKLSDKRRYLYALGKVAVEVGEWILKQKHQDISDTHDYKGHESSTIDVFARDKLLASLDCHIPRFEGTIRSELKPFKKILLETEKHDPLVLIIDEIEGTTNTKRCLASAFGYNPPALVSLALSLSESLKDLIVSVVYTLDHGELFSALRVSGGEFLTFHNHQLINPEQIIHTLGDSRKRIHVIGYSNSYRMKKGELEQALYDKKLRTYEGCRSSGMDVINLIRNATDAYIDLRRFWSTIDAKGEEKEAMLQVYDIAGVIPIAEGCGLKVTDAEGKSWKEYKLEDSLSLVVSRPDIHQIILDIIWPLVEKWKKQ